MDRQQELYRIKTIPPEVILKDLNIPFTKRPSYIEASAVWRGEKRPSVSIQQNDLGEWLWHDFGSGSGGSWIDLVMVLYGWDYVTAVKFLREKYLEDLDLSFPSMDHRSSYRLSTVKILEVRKVSHPALLKYLKERRIEKIPDWLKEVHWQVGERKFFGVGVQTEGGSWSVRNKLGKWTIRESRKQKHSYTLIEKGSPYLAVFEGLFDALTYEQLKLKEADLLVLNSTVNLEKALKVLERYEVVILALDNDEAGISARRKVEMQLPDRTINLSFSAKDLNEAFCKGERITLKR
jgi:5S rRNA maturation endonuclease (ribonuclease M5)